MSKKLRLLVLMVALLSLVVACNSPSDSSVGLNEFLITEGVALTGDMDEMAASEDYLALMTGGTEALKPVIDEIATQDYSKPENAYLITLPDDALLSLVRQSYADMDISTSIMEKIKYRISNSTVLANMINAQHGSETIAVTAMLTYGKSYIQPEGWSDNRLLILDYPGEFSSLVSFAQSGEGVISSNSVFVNTGDKDLLSLLSELLGKEDLEADQYSESELAELLGE